MKVGGRSNSQILSIFDHTVLDSSTIESYFHTIIWLDFIQPQLRKYLIRKGQAGLSRDLDEQMVGDLRNYLLLLVNFTLLRERLLREPPLV